MVSLAELDGLGTGLFAEEPEFVIAFGADAGPRHQIGQRIRMLALTVVHASGDDRLIRIAVDEVDDDLVTDAREEDAAPSWARPQFRDADETGMFLGVFGATIPVELNLAL